MEIIIYFIFMLSILGIFTFFYIRNKSNLSIYRSNFSNSGNFNASNTETKMSPDANNIFLKNAQTNLNDLRKFRTFYFICLILFIFFAIAAVGFATYYFIIDFKIEFTRIVSYSAVFTSNYTCYRFLKEFLKVNKAYSDALDKLMNFSKSN